MELWGKISDVEIRKELQCWTSLAQLTFQMLAQTLNYNLFFLIASNLIVKGFRVRSMYT